MNGFTLKGSYLTYAHDFVPGKVAWIACYAVHPHFETRLAHIHGSLFALLNIVFRPLIMVLPVGMGSAKWVSSLALAGLLMPVGIFSEIYLGLPPILVLLGATCVVLACVTLSVSVVRMIESPAEIIEIS